MIFRVFEIFNLWYDSNLFHQILVLEVAVIFFLNKSAQEKERET